MCKKSQSIRLKSIEAVTDQLEGLHLVKTPFFKTLGTYWSFKLINLIHFCVQKIRAASVQSANSSSEASKPQNKNLNRYRDVHPYDHSRVILQRGSTDYINANLCKVEKANR